MPRLRSLALVLASLTLGCSLINAPDEINPGTGGTAGSGAGGTGATGASGGTGGTGGGLTCEVPEDCAPLTTECATGECDAGTCVATPMPAGTLCGAAPTSSCDLQDTCDDGGMCVASFVPNGTFCEDCAMGPGLCETCQDGACGDCTTRAATKTFNHPLSASGWTLTGGWAIYAKTPPTVEKVFKGACNDGADNDGDGFIDMADPSCDNPNDQSEFQPSQCQNGADDDVDGFFDLNDPDCKSIGDDTELASEPMAFEHPVLGTDGNRVRPYGFFPAAGFGEEEVSTATSPPTVLPTQLEFRSWHMDEGLAFDLKAVAVSTNGQDFTVLAICTPMMGAFPFCERFTSPLLGGPFPMTRDIEDWDDITLSVPPQMVGQVGYVRFSYDTTDTCCDFERGWFLDALNFAQDCACTGNADCAFLDNACSTGRCDADTDECGLEAENLGTACENAADDGCALKECNSNGWCESDGIVEDGSSCDSCGDDGQCSHCVATQCRTCPATQTVDFMSTSKFVLTGDWAPQSCLAPNSVSPNSIDCFPGGAVGALQTAPMLGSNGSKTGAFPYTSGEVSQSSMVTAPTVIPANLEFKSWHQDRGGDDIFNPADKKTIRVSVDGGANWTTLVNCETAAVPFCVPSPPFVNRPLDQWDAVSIAVANDLVGQTGIFEFAYDTVDAGQGWERGWYVDDLNINRCECVQECPLIAPP